MSRRKKFITGFAAINAKNIFLGILGIVVTPIVLNFLGKTDYGIWIIISNILGYVNLFDFGITGSSRQLIAREKKDGKDISTLSSQLLFLQIVIGLIILTFGLLTFSHMPEFFNISNENIDQTKLVFILAILSLAVTFPISTYASILVGQQYIHQNAIIEFVIALLSISVQLTLLFAGFGLIALPIGLIFSKIFLFIIYYRSVKKRFPNLHLHFRIFKWRELRPILGISSFWFMGSISAMIIYSSDSIVIGKFMDVSAVATYALSFRLVDFIRNRLYSFNKAAMPGLGQLFGSGNIERIRELYLNTQYIVWIFSLIAFIIIFLFNGEFVSLWVGKEYFVGNEINILFGAYLFMTFIFHSSSIIVSASLKIKEISLMRLLEALLNISLSIYFIVKFGYIGLIGSTVLALLTTNFWYAPYKTIKILKIPFKVYFKRVFIKLVPTYLLLICTTTIIAYFDSIYLNIFVKLFVFTLATFSVLWVTNKKLLIQAIRMRFFKKNE